MTASRCGVTVSIARVSAGRGYEYLMRSIAAADGRRDGSTPLTRYYTATGNPPGRWFGAGLDGLGNGLGLKEGSEVSEQQMFRLFGQGLDPVTGKGLGVRPYRAEPGCRRGSVAGFDLTFSAPKSVSVLWGLADAGLQEQIALAHQAAVQACLRFVEAEVAATRIGANGVAQAEVRGIVAAGFDHWDSRANDPNLHTHMVIANRVQGLDGAWRTLDSRALYRAVVAISETYNGLLADELTRRLGVAWEARPRHRSAAPAWEITGVPDELIALFSRRSRDIEGEKDRLLDRFRDEHGRAPTAVEILRLRQQATLATRPDKQLHSLADLTAQWRDRAAPLLADRPEQWARDRCGHTIATSAEVDHAAVAVSARDAVQGKRATWSRWNLHAEAARQLMGFRFATDTERLAAIGKVADLSAGESVLLTPPELAPTPAVLRRRDGSSLFRFRHAQRYSSRALLQAEARLLDAGRDHTGPRVDGALIDAVLAVPPPSYRYRLGCDQAAAVTSIAGSGRLLDLLVGPAGTGKTVTLAGLRAAWETAHGIGTVIGLAPSATAAHVLADELRIATENTAKWLTEADAEPARLAEIDSSRALIAQAARVNPPLAAALQQRVEQLTARVERWRLHPGQLVLIDEASLAGTLVLDRITTAARDAGAKVVLVGDWAQLSAIDAGGAFRLLVDEHRHAPELGAVRRFTARWERDASQRLRTGDHTVLDLYAKHDRIHGGSGEVMLDAAYQAWLADQRAGRRSLLIAGDAATVRDLNARAHNDLVDVGTVAMRGVALHDGTHAGVGDRIVTRRNDRRLTHLAGHVKNGDTWTITTHAADGALTVADQRGATVTLPADYVARDVELGYATTAYRAQGATVDTAHVVVTAGSRTRETLYVAITRGRQGNTAYVATDSRDECTVHDHSGADARDLLGRILERTGADTAAHAQLRAEQDAAASIVQLAAEYDTIAAVAQTLRWRQLLRASGLTADQVQDAESSPAWGALSAALRHADAAGADLETALPALVAQRSLADASDLAAVLHERVTRWADRHQIRDPRLIAGLIPVARVDDREAQAALDERARLINLRADALVSHALSHGAPWLTPLGAPTSEPHRRRAWLAAARTIAAFHDRYSGSTGTATSRELDAVRRATQVAAALAATDEPRTSTPAVTRSPHRHV